MSIGMTWNAITREICAHGGFSPEFLMIKMKPIYLTFLLNVQFFLFIIYPEPEHINYTGVGGIHYCEDL